MRDPERRLLSIDQAVAWRNALRRRGAELAVTNGCFDLLHAGHVRSLVAARREGDAVLVLLNSDRSVAALKGPGRPVYCERDRAYLLGALRSVDYVLVFRGTNCATELNLLAPDIYVKGEDFRDTQHPGEKAALAACGCRTVWLPREPGLSTTAAIAAAARGGNPA